MGLHFQQRQHHHFRRPGPTPPPRRNRRHRRHQLPDERPNPNLSTEPFRSNLQLSKPAILLPVFHFLDLNPAAFSNRRFSYMFAPPSTKIVGSFFWGVNGEKRRE